MSAGDELTFDQDDVDFDGHAIEFRINAENAATEFSPATGGTLSTYDPPGGIGVRVDDALRQGDDLVTDYDSLIAKLIVWGEDREECLARSRRALAEYDIEGVTTIVPFHRLMCTDDRFVAGTHTTKFLDEVIDPDRLVEAQERWGSEDTEGAGEDVEVIEREFTVEVNGKRFAVELEERGPPAAAGARSSGPPPSQDRDDGDSREEAPTGDGESVTAEMQGTVLSVAVEEGDEVAAGDVVVVLEAMKMENDIVASRGGTVSHVAVAEGESVDMGNTLVVLE